MTSPAIPVILLPAPRTGLPFVFDKTAPSLDNVTAFTTPTSDNVTSYTFSSDEAGTIDIVGDCSGSVITATAVADNNTIIFDALADGTYDNCIITVTDNASNKSDNLSVSSFTIGRLTPALAEVTARTHTRQ